MYFHSPLPPNASAVMSSCCVSSTPDLVSQWPQLSAGELVESLSKWDGMEDITSLFEHMVQREKGGRVIVISFMAQGYPIRGIFLIFDNSILSCLCGYTSQ